MNTFMVVVLCLIHFIFSILIQSSLNPYLILNVEALSVLHPMKLLLSCGIKLVHISNERVMKLVKDEILPQLDSSDRNVCIDSLKGK